MRRIEPLMNASQYWEANDFKHFVTSLAASQDLARTNQPPRSMFRLISRTDMDAPAICHESSVRGSRGHQRSALAAHWYRHLDSRVFKDTRPARKRGCWDTRFLMKAVLPDGGGGGGGGT